MKSLKVVINGDSQVESEIFKTRNNSEREKGFTCSMRKVLCLCNLQNE